jgi:hypothetical protein
MRAAPSTLQRVPESRPLRALADRPALLALALLATGCASVDPRVDPFSRPPIAQHLARSDGVGECARLLREYDRRVLAAGARDAQDTIVAGFPYLRADRLAVHLAGRIDAGAVPRPAPATLGEPTALWLQRLAALDRDARRHELRNAADHLPVDAPMASMGLDGCRAILLDEDSSRADTLQAIRAAARVPDDYSAALRVLGAYWLTRIPFAAGVRGWQRDTVSRFAQPLESLPVQGELRRYAVTGAGWPASAVTITRDALGVPRIDPVTRGALLRWHAPVLEIDHTGEHDRPGALLVEDDAVRVDTDGLPLVYTRLAFAELGGLLRPQLVYTVWFSARPRDHALDLLGGHLDALVWRVTLDDDGRPLLFDSIHACGCWHQFFPTLRVRARPAPPEQGAFDEGLFVPQAPLAPPRDDERIVLRLSARTHQVQRVSLQGAPPAAAAPAAPATTYPATTYRLADDDSLRSLPLAGGLARRSVYDARGFVPGSERLERFIFWPMGIASAGQMRQWGRHATAFVGRRHFDDPLLLQRYFDLATPAE